MNHTHRPQMQISSLVEKGRQTKCPFASALHNYLVAIHMNLYLGFYCEKIFEIERTHAPTFVA